MEELTLALGKFAETLAAMTNATEIKERNELAQRAAGDLYSVLNIHSMLIATKVAARLSEERRPRG